jgi:flagellar protein FliJ
MKTYVFRLAPVLKLRRLKEENCRMELGQLIGQLARIDNQILHEQIEIQNYYKIQETGLKNGIRGDQIQSFPLLVTAKEKNIQLLLKEKKIQEEAIETKRKELSILRGELKVIEKLHEKDYSDYRRAINKEIDQKVEEQTQNWLQHKERKA